MKKLFALMISLLLIATIGMKAQTSGTTYTLPAGQTYYNAFSDTHTGDWDATTLKDSIGGTATKYWVFAINKSALYYYQFFVEYDTVLTIARATGNHVTVWLDASIDGTNYVTIDSTLFHPTAQWLPANQSVTAAAALLGVYNLRDVSTGVLYRYLKIRAVGGDANTCALISKLAVKVGLRY
jgi:hypothetical protein